MLTIKLWDFVKKVIIFWELSRKFTEKKVTLKGKTLFHYKLGLLVEKWYIFRIKSFCIEKKNQCYGNTILRKSHNITRNNFLVKSRHILIICQFISKLQLYTLILRLFLKSFNFILHTLTIYSWNNRFICGT